MYNTKELFQIINNCNTEEELFTVNQVIHKYHKDYSLESIYMVIGLTTAMQKQLNA